MTWKNTIIITHFEPVSLPYLPRTQFACTLFYCSLWSLWVYHIFPHHLINDTILGKMLLNIKFVLWFPPQAFSEIFLILRRIQQDIIINVHSLDVKYLIFLSDSKKNWNFLDRFSKKTQKINFVKNLSSRSRVVPWGRTARQTNWQKWRS